MVGVSVGDTTLGTLVANLGYDKVTMPKPVFIGDTLRVETEVTELRGSKSRPNAGIVTFRHRAFNQRNEMVCEAPAHGAGEADMRLRSLLFVPGDRPDRMEKAGASGADALILDLEDSVAVAEEGRSAPSRGRVPGHAARPCRSSCASMPWAGRPTRTWPPSCRRARTASCCPRRKARPRWRSWTAASRRWATNAPPSCRLPRETPAAIFALGSYGDVTPRLCGLSWGAEDLPAAIGATTAREADGGFTPPYEMVRALALFGAHAARVPAIETIFPAFQR